MALSSGKEEEPHPGFQLSSAGRCSLCFLSRHLPILRSFAFGGWLGEGHAQNVAPANLKEGGSRTNLNLYGYE